MCFFFVSPDAKESPPALFSGDTLFVAGCGRFFEGNAQDMYNALYTRLEKLPDETRVYSGHEYTVNNLKFASEVDTENKAVIKKLEWANSQREKGVDTQGGTLGEEKTYNPFLRVHTPSVAKAVGHESETIEPIKVMELLRAKKDSWGVGSSAPKSTKTNNL